MITGEKPPSSLDRLQNDMLQLPSQRGADIPRYAEQLLMYALAVRAEQRIQSSNEFLNALVEEQTLHLEPDDELTALDYVKFIVVFVGVMIFTAFLVCFGLERAINGKDVFLEMSGRQTVQETVIASEAE